jgi:hypothetical protein
MSNVGETGNQQAFVPSAPTDVMQTPGTGGVSGRIIINWTEPSDNGGDAILYYNVYKTVNGVQSLDVSGISLTTATLTGLMNGSSYTFQVSAVNINGEGAYSTASAQIIPYLQVNLIPSNLTQTYTGSPLSITVVSSPSGAPISITYSGNHTDAGSYNISAVVTGNAFRASQLNTTLQILQATATVDVSNLTQVWTGSSLQPTVTTSPSGLTTTIRYVGNHTDPGTYAFTVDISENNYTGSVSDTLTITGTSGSAPCFPKGTPILTPSGYKAVETLEQGSLVLTADGRPVPLKLFGGLLSTATKRSAPYFIPRGALGSNMPLTDLTLSPDHAFLLRKGVWMLPSKAATLSKKVRQLGIGEPVHYFHVECPNYLKDNLVINGATVESYAGKQLDFVSPYTWSESLKGYTRMGDAKTATKSKAAHA